MNDLYQRLGHVLSSIEPRNERARTWLDKLVLLCHANAGSKLDSITHKASIGGVRFDFHAFLITQGKDPAQRDLYAKVESLFKELETVDPTY